MKGGRVWQNSEGREEKKQKELAAARWRIHFSGRVQHVGFRYTAFYLARGLHLTGWVDNLADGRVEMEAQGKSADLRKLVIQLKSQPHIHITKVQIRQIECVPRERAFRVGKE